MTRLVFDATGWDKVDDRLLGTEERVQDARPVWDDIADLVTEDVTDWFDSQGHGTWAPLSDRYAGWKAQHYPGQAPLVLTETLRDSLVVKGGSREYSVLRWDHDSLEVGTSDPVAHLAVKQGRPPADVDDADVDEYVEVLGRWVLYGEETP